MSRAGYAGANPPCAGRPWVLRYGFTGTSLLTRPFCMPAISNPQVWPKHLGAGLAMAATLGAGLAGGSVARLIHLPLPWLLGSLVTIMALSLAGAPVRLIRWGRPAGTVVVGTSTGLQFTA